MYFKTHQERWSKSSKHMYSLKKCVFKNFPKFAGMYLCRVLSFNKVVDLQFGAVFQSAYFVENLRTAVSIKEKIQSDTFLESNR